MSKQVLANCLSRDVRTQSINWATDQPGDGTKKQMGVRFNVSRDNVMILFQLFSFLCFVSGLNNTLPMLLPGSASPDWRMIEE